MPTIAVLLTCYNRVDTTIKCLTNLYNAKLPDNYLMDVYLVDDKSPDQTGSKVKKLFPKVMVIEGTGSLYWNGGMRLAWETAAGNKDYDFFLWLNDDSMISEDAIVKVFKDYQSCSDHGSEAIIIGSFLDPRDKTFSYGGYYGKWNYVPVTPNGQPQKCTYINGNFVLIPQKVFRVLGNLSSCFTHSIGDTDYGLRAIKAGFSCMVSSDYIGSCESNDKIAWSSESLPFCKRFRLLFSKTNGNILEFWKFIFIHYGLIVMLFSVVKTTVTLFIPKVFNNFRPSWVRAKRHVNEK